jgi:hypothetical protein
MRDHAYEQAMPEDPRARRMVLDQDRRQQIFEESRAAFPHLTDEQVMRVVQYRMANRKTRRAMDARAERLTRADVRKERVKAAKARKS